MPAVTWAVPVLPASQHLLMVLMFADSGIDAPLRDGRVCTVLDLKVKMVGVGSSARGVWCSLAWQSW